MPIINMVYNFKPEPQFATQWPCPKGFHVPTGDEIGYLSTILSAFWYSYRDSWVIRQWLKAPMSWYRQYRSGNVGDAWSRSFLWSCTGVSWNARYRHIEFDGYTSTWNWRAMWYWANIRPFKNTPEIPDSSWTTIAKSWNAWIYHNADLWLISFTADWTTRETCADKNLWATQVYNEWDTLSEANCWCFYQAGNNYWFPYSWSVTTSSTTVDTTGYWPWNYYSSSTFIKQAWWCNPVNYNLWWWEDWNVPV